MTEQDVINLILENEGRLNKNQPGSDGGVTYNGITQNTSSNCWRSRREDNSTLGGRRRQWWVGARH